jgi:two-component system phosphate regulon sensor histidine kinase PhoR
MTIIRSMAETLVDGPEIYQEKGQAYLERIIAEVDRLSLISNDLLILSAAESNLVRKHACDVAVTFRTVVRDLSSKAIEKGLVLSYTGPETFDIEANGSQMTQVALNLVENALNYTPSGRVRVLLEPDEENITVSIEDTGLGISSDQLPRIFERFYRVDKGRSRATGGTGLGLSIVKHIVEAHGGNVRVESELHKGSTFIVRLPIGNVRHESDHISHQNAG